MSDQQYAAIDNFLLDCLLSEELTLESEISSYPVESGSDVSDNIMPKPLVVKMEVIISSTPIGKIANGRSGVAGGVPTPGEQPSDPAEFAYEFMLNIYESRMPVSIRTSMRTYDNMAMKSLSVPRSVETGGGLTFTAVFQQVQMVENKRTVRVAVPMAVADTTANKPPKGTSGDDDVLGTRAIDNAGHWFDPHIHGWRDGALYSGIKGVIVTPGSGLGGANNVSTIAYWELIRGRPLSVPYDQWHAKPLTDAQVKVINDALGPPVSGGITRNLGQSITILTRDQYVLR